MSLSEDLPPSFLCPITHELMEDPVSLLDGHSYERKAIQKWFDTGHATSPLTGKHLGVKSLQTNFALKNAIEEFKKQRPQYQVRTQTLEQQNQDLLKCIELREKFIQEVQAKLEGLESKLEVEPKKSDFVTQWLETLELSEYIEKFREYGFDKRLSLYEIKAPDLVEMKVKPGHARLILRQVAANILKESEANDEKKKAEQKKKEEEEAYLKQLEEKRRKEEEARVQQQIEAKRKREDELADRQHQISLMGLRMEESRRLALEEVVECKVCHVRARRREFSGFKCVHSGVWKNGANGVSSLTMRWSCCGNSDHESTVCAAFHRFAAY